MALKAIFLWDGSRPFAYSWMVPIASSLVSSDVRGKGQQDAGCPALVVFLLEAPGLALARATRSSHEALSPTPPSIQNDSPEPSEVIGPLALLFPVVLGATAPHLLDLCCCWSILGCSIGPGGTSTPWR